MARGDSPLRPSKRGALLDLRVRPGSSRSGAVEVREGRLVLAVHAAPEAGKANREALKILSGMLGVAASELELVRGASSRNKTVLLKGMTLEEAEIRLSKYFTIK
ncbi:MAG: DUF167 domain-containing protein [Actinomycetota bacterium]|nr:DUF167 domain-containing protein [Actinomycetota bacterium]